MNINTNRDHSKIRKREYCAVCGSHKFEVVIDLPNLPLTGRYSREPMQTSVPGIDQQLIICERCGHVQLARQVLPETLYGECYSFRTSKSSTAQHGTDFFLGALNQLAPDRQFKCILDVGCNDLYLLEKLQDRSNVRVGIDPVSIPKMENNDGKILNIISENIEDADLDAVLPSRPDLIVCRHTLEHIFDPNFVLQKLLSVADENALFLFEVPGLEALLNRFRFDQVFHQHLQYFTLHSFENLLHHVGGVYLSHWENYHDWGALLVAFTKDKRVKKKKVEIKKPIHDVPDLSARYQVFQNQMSVVHDTLSAFPATNLYGYGAAQMLPVLSYHLKDDFSSFTAVLDDDSAKHGIYYWNLPLIIRQVESVSDLGEATVFITAVDNVKPIMNRLLERRPKHIIYPFCIM